MMKKINLFYLLFALMVFNNTFAQVPNRLIGVWQVNSPNLADAWLSNYRFFKDGTFKYSFSQYEDRGRIREAKGTYKLIGDKLTLIIKSRTELVGGDLVGGSLGFQQEELVLDGGKPVEVKQKIITPIELVVKWFIKKGVKGFTVQNNTYYLISTDPHKEED